MEEKKDPQKKTAWVHGAQIGVGPLRDAAQTARDAVASTIESMKAELEKKRAVLAGFGKR